MCLDRLLLQPWKPLDAASFTTTDVLIPGLPVKHVGHGDADENDEMALFSWSFEIVFSGWKGLHCIKWNTDEGWLISCVFTLERIWDTIRTRGV